MALSQSKGSAENVINTLKDLILDIKPRLNATVDAEKPHLVENINRVAALAESLTNLYPKKRHEFGDFLDREGVNLWNTSGLLSQGEKREVVVNTIAALRLAAFRLVEAGLESNPGLETSLHLLQMASNTAAAQSEIGKHDVAGSVLTCAAKFEEIVRKLEDSDDNYKDAKSRATIVYLSARLEVAWREGNDAMANFMLQKITENHSHNLASLAPSDKALLSSKLLEIGKTVLKQHIQKGVNAPTAQDAVSWIQQAFSITEQMDDASTPGMAELKRSILRSLARAYFMASDDNPENLTRSETALHELITSIDESPDHTKAEYQQLRWMRIAILKKRKADSESLLSAFVSVVDHLVLEQLEITELLQELKSLVHQHAIVTAITLRMLSSSLDPKRHQEPNITDRLLLSFIVHCAKDDLQARAISDLETAFQAIVNAEFTLSKTTATACITLLWQYGDRHYHAKKWTTAADWFLKGGHRIFTGLGQSSSAKCLRKAALCYLQSKDYSHAAAVIRRCPTSEATTHYVILLTAVHQGLEDEAIRAVRDMVTASDFNRNMLLLATQISHESGLKNLLLSVLDALLGTSKVKEGATSPNDAMTVIRCSIRLITKLLGEAAANVPALVITLVEHFDTAMNLVRNASASNQSNVIMKDISWLWRTAYNCGTQGCADWVGSDRQITALFIIAAELLEVYCRDTLGSVGEENYLHLINAYFSAASGQVFTLRQSLAENEIDDRSHIDTALARISSTVSRILQILAKSIISKPEDISLVLSFVHILRVFEIELLCHVQEWPRILQAVQTTVNSDHFVVSTFEEIADLLWAQKDCPVEVLFVALEAILHASLDRKTLSVERFSRWLRGLCTILLARNSPADRVKALGYVEQALTVMGCNATEQDENEIYPVDERQWLVGSTYNTGIECLHAYLLDEAKRWFEVSTVICQYVPAGEARAAKIAEAYTHLLSRYDPQ